MFKVIFALLLFLIVAGTGFADEIGAPEATEEAKPSARKIVFTLGGATGFFAGATTFLAEARFHLKYIFGPATTAARLGLGLAQSRNTDQRYVPVTFDLIFNFPAGRLTGVENYLGGGLNSAGNFGGELFYGVQSEGFGGMVFGELGYAILRNGAAPSHKGVTALVGWRR